MNRYQQAQGCPGCGGTKGVELTRTTSRVSEWNCTRCEVNSVVNPHLWRDYPAALAARIERLAAARLILREVITLADEASTLTDLELRDRLRALAQGAW